MIKKENSNVLAIDFGASGGRAMLGFFDGQQISMEEIHRFSNDPVFVNGTMYWDVLRLLHEIKQSLIKANRVARVESVAVDTWGVDFGLLDADGNLMENPVHYRDDRTTGMLELSRSLIPPEQLYKITGNQFMEINTAFQLLSLRELRPGLLQRADTLLMMPDLFNYFLTGNKAAEASIASTSQLFDMRKREWSDEVIGALGLPRHIFPAVIPSGTVVGTLTDGICNELQITEAKVIAITGHDTQSALAAIPAKETDFLFLSCGTWSLMGTELDEPLINDHSLNLNLTNESSYGGKISFLKNIIGLWLIQETRRQWTHEGREYSYAELEQLSRAEKPFQYFIDPDAPAFVPTGDIPERIRQYCRETGQPIPENDGQIVRCIYESLAMKYRFSMDQIESCTGKRYGMVYIVGGGVNNTLLCRMTASACGRTVSAGPTEATVLGNIAIQLMALGELGGVTQARDCIANSYDITQYSPEDTEAWDRAYKKFREVTEC